MKHDLENIVNLLDEIYPVLKDFFSHLREAAENQAGKGYGFGLIITYSSQYNYTLEAALGRIHLHLKKSTGSMGSFAPSFNRINIDFCAGRKSYSAYYSESSGGYARINPNQAVIVPA